MTVGASWRFVAAFGDRHLALSGVRRFLILQETQGARPAIEGRSGHSEIPCDLGCWLTAVYEAAGVAYLYVGDDPRATAQIFAGIAAFGDLVDYTLSLDFMFHVTECGHDSKRHGTHGCCRVDVAAAQVQHAEAGATAPELFGEGKYVLCRSPQPVQSRDDESIARLARLARVEHVER